MHVNTELFVLLHSLRCLDETREIQEASGTVIPKGKGKTKPSTHRIRLPYPSRGSPPFLLLLTGPVALEDDGARVLWLLLLAGGERVRLAAWPVGTG